MTFHLKAFAVLLLAASNASATEVELAKLEVLPAPKEIVEEDPAIAVVPMSGVWRPSRYDVWQNYGIDQAGRFRPLVIYSPIQPYYRANGHPYFYAPVKPRAFAPALVD